MKPIEGANLTRTRELHQGLTLLTSLESTDAPLLSCYLDLRHGEAGWRAFLDAQAASLRRRLQGSVLADCEQALAQIEARLARGVPSGAQGLALFARAPVGGRFFLELAFAVPVENRLTLYVAPDLAPLLELRDRCDRFLLARFGGEGMQVVDVDLGVTAVRAWAVTERGKRAGLVRFLRRRRDEDTETRRAQARQLRLLDRLLRRGGQPHLFLAGDEETLGDIAGYLPPRLQERLVELLALTETARVEEAVARCLDALQRYEQSAADMLASHLLRSARTRGRAVTGGLASLQALREGHAETLVMVRGYRPDTGWRCTHCGGVGMQHTVARTCPACGAAPVQDLDLRVELVHLAARQGVTVELVDCRELLYRGGVGCLLHYRAERRAARRRPRLQGVECVA